MPGLAAAQRPNAPSTCTQARRPRGRAATIASKGSKAPLFTQPAWAQTIVGPVAEAVERVAERVGAQPALVVGGDDRDLVGADAQVAERDVDGDVALGTDHDPQRRRAGQPGALDVDADAGQHVVAGGGEADDVRHLGAGHQAERHAGRQAEQVDEPGADDLLGDGRGGAHDAEGHVLVPGGGEPVGGERGGQGAAGDEAEVAGAVGRDEAAGRRGGERLDGAAGVGWLVRSGPPSVRRRSSALAAAPTGRSSRPSRWSAAISAVR